MCSQTRTGPAGGACGLARRSQRKRKMTARMQEALTNQRMRKAIGDPSSISEQSSDEEPSPSPARQETQFTSPGAGTPADHVTGQSSGVRQLRADHGASGVDEPPPVLRAETSPSPATQPTVGPAWPPTLQPDPFQPDPGAARVRGPGAIAAAVCAAAAHAQASHPLGREAEIASPAGTRPAQSEASAASALRAACSDAQAGELRPCAWVSPAQWANIEQALDDPTATVELTAALSGLSLQYLSDRAHLQMKQAGLQGPALALAVKRAFRVKDALEEQRQRCGRAGRSLGVCQPSAAAVAKPARSPAQGSVPTLTPACDHSPPADSSGTSAAAASQSQPPMTTACTGGTPVPTLSPPASPSAVVAAAAGSPDQLPNPAASATALETGHPQLSNDSATAATVAPAARQLPVVCLTMPSALQQQGASYGADAAIHTSVLPERRPEVADSVAGANPEAPASQPAGGDAVNGELDASPPLSAGAAFEAPTASGQSPPEQLATQACPSNHVPDATDANSMGASAAADDAASPSKSRPLPEALVPRYAQIL